MKVPTLLVVGCWLLVVGCWLGKCPVVDDFAGNSGKENGIIKSIVVNTPVNMLRGLTQSGTHILPIAAEKRIHVNAGMPIGIVT